MRFLLDQNLPPQLADLLAIAGHDAVRVRTLAMSRAADRDALIAARDHARIVVSSDTDCRVER